MEIDALKDDTYSGVYYPYCNLYRGIKAKLVERREVQCYNDNTHNSYMEIEYEFYFPELEKKNVWSIKKSYLSKSRIILDKIKDDNNLLLTCLMYFRTDCYGEEDFKITRMINVKEDCT